MTKQDAPKRVAVVALLVLELLFHGQSHGGGTQVEDPVCFLDASVIVEAELHKEAKSMDVGHLLYV